MPLIITEEQNMLKTSAREFLQERAPVTALRKLRDDRDETGFDRQLWQEMAGMGWASLTIPEAYGGLNFGFVGLGQILEEMGRTLTASPLMSTVLLSATLLQKCGNVLQKESLLPAIAEGRLLIALALEEGRQHHPTLCNTSVQQQGDGFLLNGQKVFVLDGHVADHFIVLARTSGEVEDQHGLSLFLVDAKAKGVKIKRTIMMDSRNAAVVSFEQVSLSDQALIGTIGNAFPVFEEILDIARIGLCAEMLGNMQEAFERALAYLKERRQFGVSIGSFQALQHRAAQLFCEIELCKSLVLQSLQAIDKGAPNLAILASMTKAKVGEVLQLVTNEAVQMFGGIGMTDDEEIGFFLKRARVAQQTLGDYNYHLDRFARLNGF